MTRGQPKAVSRRRPRVMAGGRMRVIERRTVYQGRVIRLLREIIQARGQRMVRETILHPGSVVLVPVLGDRRIVFVRQYRRAIGRDLLELPAGTLSPGEDRRVCAQRELEEETGWRARRLRQIGAFYPAPGFLSESMSIFLATELAPVPTRPEPDEFLEPVILTLAAALKKIHRGGIRDAKSVIGILFTERLLRRRGCRARIKMS